MSSQEIRKIINLLESVQRRSRLLEFSDSEMIVDFSKIDKKDLNSLMLKHHAPGLSDNTRQLPRGSDGIKYRKIVNVIIPFIDQHLLEPSHACDKENNTREEKDKATQFFKKW